MIEKDAKTQINEAIQVLDKFTNELLLKEKDVSAEVLAPFIASIISGVYERMKKQFLWSDDKKNNGITGVQFVGYVAESIQDVQNQIIKQGEFDASTDEENRPEDHH